MIGLGAVQRYRPLPLSGVFMLSLPNLKYETTDALSLCRKVGGYLNIENQLTKNFLRNAENCDIKYVLTLAETEANMYGSDSTAAGEGM